MKQQSYFWMSLLYALMVISVFSNLNECEAENTRDDLPNDVQPTGYLLKLKPLPEDDIYVGFVKISVLCYTNTTSITLHADPSLFIPLNGVFLKEPGPYRSDAPIHLPVLSLRRNAQTSQLTVVLGTQLEQWATYELKIHFSGKFVRPEDWGFFKREYNGGKWYIGTKMKPGTARNVFPCFDGTEYKATFSISVAKPNASQATILSSTKRRSVTKARFMEGWLWENFHNTPRMLPSSIGLAMFQLNKVVKGNVSSVHTDISVYGSKDISVELGYLLEDFMNLFSFLKGYLNRTIPLEKIDIVVFPNFEYDLDTNSWGLIFMSDYLLPNDLSALHGLLDQWFRHFSTPLNHDSPLLKALRKVLFWQSGFKKWEPANNLDGLLGDDDTSQKRSSEPYEWLLRMLNYSISPEAFRLGIKNFIGDRQEFAVYTDSVLWYFLTQSGHHEGTLDSTISVQEIAYSWVGLDLSSGIAAEETDTDDFSWSRVDQDHILTEGNARVDHMPVVTVTRIYQDNSALVEQHVFVKRRMYSGNYIESFWWIPVLYLTQENAVNNSLQLSTWMRGESEIRITGLPSRHNFIIVNPEYAGQFVVNYDHYNWKLLIEYLNSDKYRNIPELTRSKLLYDSWNLAYFGELDIETALNMSLFLRKETSEAVWKPFLALVNEFLEYVSDTPVEPLLEEYILNQLLAATLRGADWISYSLLCRFGYEVCIDDFREAFWLWAKQDNLEYKLTYEQFCYTFKYGNMTEFETGLKYLTKHEKKDKWNYSNLFFLLQTLAVCPVDAEKINRYLDVIFVEKNKNFSDVDIMSILIRFKNHAQGRWMAILDFLSQNFASAKDRIGKAPNIWNMLISEATRHFITQLGLNEIVAFHKNHKGQFGSADPFIQSAKYKVASEVNWSTKNLEKMEKWLLKQLTIRE